MVVRSTNSSDSFSSRTDPSGRAIEKPSLVRATSISNPDDTETRTRICDGSSCSRPSLPIAASWIMLVMGTDAQLDRKPSIKNTRRYRIQLKDQKDVENSKTFTFMWQPVG